MPLCSLQVFKGGFLSLEHCALFFILVLAVCLDLLLGDRENWPHPVRWMGRAVLRTCSFAGRLPFSPFWQGASASIFLVFMTWVVVYLVQGWACGVSHLLCVISGGLTVYFGISLRCLAQEAEAVALAIEDQGLDAARRQLSRIVGRDTGALDEVKISMAVIETVAENFVDGVLSPFFYAAVTGPAGCMAYKMINTLDSMIGYRDSRYILFGRFAARSDDVANYIPARLSLPCIVVGMICLPSLKSIHSLSALIKGIISDMDKHSSPNSGLPESAFAWTLGVRLGGPVSYKGSQVEYPYINEGGREPGTGDIRRAVSLLYSSSTVLFLVAVAIIFFSCAGLM